MTSRRPVGTAPFEGLEVGYDLPALPGMALSEVVTPCLAIELSAFERNLRRMARIAQDHGVSLRAHGKMHKSVDVARRQHEIGGAQGICCQKVSEAEAFVRGGIRDVLVSNQVRHPRMIQRLAALPRHGAKVAVCVDDLANVAELSEACRAAGSELGVLVELDSGAGRCGVGTAAEAVALAHAIHAAPGLRLEGLQAYQGNLQHIEEHAERRAAAERSIARAREARDAIRAAGLPCDTVTGAGSGSYEFEAASGVYTELQCGSYAFMDADYGRIRDAAGDRLDATWDNALFLLTTIVSHAKPGLAVCDAGLKAQSVDSGLPVIFGRDDIRYIACSDEHGNIDDPSAALRPGDMLRLVPGHCDPTCNLHDWYVVIDAGKVVDLWPVSARGKAF